MKKSILIGVLCALMLFAFTSCEQSMPSYEQIQYVTVAQKTAYIEGQPLSADNFEVVVHYLDGTTDVYPGAGRVSFGSAEEAGAGVKATGTIAEKSDTIDVLYVAPTGLTAVLSAAEQDCVYTEEGRPATSPSDSIKVVVESATLTADGISWELTKDQIAESLNAADVRLAAGEKTAVGTYTKTTTVSYGSYDFQATVDVTVVENPDDPKNPDYVAPDTARALNKGEVTKLGVVWADVDDSDFADGTYDIDDVDTVAANTITVGDKVVFTLVGLADDMTNRYPYILKAEDYQTVGEATIDDQATDKDDITDRVVGEEDPIPALTATYQFKPDTGKDTPNYGLRASIKLTVTVEDALTSTAVTNPTFVYQGKDVEGVWTATQLEAGKSATLYASDFTAKVKTVGEEEVTLVATTIYGADKYQISAEEATAGASFTVNLQWSYAETELGGPYNGTTQVTVSVANAE